MVEEIKNLDGAKWEPSESCWYANNNERNLYWLNRLAGIKDYRYDEPYELIQPRRKEMREHQIKMLSFAYHARRCVLAGEMGVGKTLVAIELMEAVSQDLDASIKANKYVPKDQDNPENQWIVVCPARAIVVWEMELKKWNSCIKPTKIISYAKLKDLRTLGENIIYDEGHALSNFDTKRTQSAYSIARSSFGYILVLSGTPAPRDPTNWWSLCEILQPGYIREPNPHKFKYRIGVFETNVNSGGREYKKLINWIPEQVKLLHRRIGGMCLPVYKKDCLDLPDKIYQEVQLPYGKREEELVKSIVLNQGTGIQTLQRLRQLSDGFDYRGSCKECLGLGFHDIVSIKCKKCNGSGKVTRNYATPKDLAIQQYLNDFLDLELPRIVIYGAYRESIDKVVSFARKLKWSVIRVDGRGIECDSGVNLERFQDRNFREPIAFIGHPDSGGQGFTLTCSENLIYYSNDFNGKARIQSEDRIHRIGTTKATIVDLLWLPTDRYILENLKNKRDLMDVSMGQLQEYVAKESGKYY